MNHNKGLGFTLIELLVVISIIGLLAAIVLVAMNGATVKARDARRKAELKQLSTAVELYFSNNSAYPGTAGWLSNPNHGGLDGALTPTYMAKVPDDPKYISGGDCCTNEYMYWRKDYSGYSCLNAPNIQQFGFYAKLENPTAADSATLTDSFDQCVATTWGMNYKIGN